MKTLRLLFAGCLGLSACHPSPGSEKWIEFAVWLYPGERLLVEADARVLLDTVGAPGPANRLSRVELPIRHDGLRRLRLLTTYRRRVYLDTTLTAFPDVARMSASFSKPFLPAEVAARPGQERYSLPPIETSRRNFRAYGPVIRY